MTPKNLNQTTVHKFGGTSVGSVDAIRKVLKLLAGENARAGESETVAVVVSAMSGITDKLIRAAQLASKQDREYETLIEQMHAQHREAAGQLLKPPASEAFLKILERDFTDLREILRGVWLGRHLPDTTLELVSGYGELWSSQLLASAWQAELKTDVTWVDARKVLVAHNGETGPQIDWAVSQNKFDTLAGSGKRLMITGFIASTPEGVPTTLKRNGSDFSAAIFGRLLRAREIVIWTDVDGVYSADPRKVPEAKCLDELSYEEAIELAYFGAKVIHPHTMGPAVALQIPIWIKNTFHPEATGTVIKKAEPAKSGPVARGFTTIDNLALVNVEGTGMIGVPGVAQRLFGALRESNVSVILISQASSEHSICLAIPAAKAEAGRQTIEHEFESELRHGQIQTIHVTAPCSIVAMVGDGMVAKKGVSARFFAALGLAGVNVRAIAQGSSERNISAVIDEKDSARALRATHSAFFLSDYTISVGVIGAGQIGKALLHQIEEQRINLEREFKIDFRVRAVGTSKKMWLSKGLEGDRLTQLPNADLDMNAADFASHLRPDHIPHAVIVDCSASDEISDHYADWLSAGLHIVTPNKKAGSGALKRFQKIRAAERESGRQFLYEATVGAGLPIISTLRDLLQTGDKLISIEGLFSGTLAYVFSEFSSNTKFSDVIRVAKEKGYTEPDPRDDLSGMDVARKIVILAREAGMNIEINDVAVKSLVTPALQSLKSVDDFMAQLPTLDADYDRQLAAAQKSGGVLRFVGAFDVATKKASAGLRALSADHPFARVKGSDNIIAFRTKRYDSQPLIVQGPGAGPEVTAAGVFADLLRLARSLGARA